MEKETSQNARRIRMISPSKGKIAHLRSRRRHPHLYRHPRIMCQSIDQCIETAPYQHDKKSDVSVKIKKLQ